MLEVYSTCLYTNRISTKLRHFMLWSRLLGWFYNNAMGMYTWKYLYCFNMCTSISHFDMLFNIFIDVFVLIHVLVSNKRIISSTIARQATRFKYRSSGGEAKWCRAILALAYVEISTRHRWSNTNSPHAPYQLEKFIHISANW